MKNLSIKWKLTVSFFLLGMMLVGAYVFMATGTFESDKISYIFDSQQEKVESLSKQFEQKLERVTFDSRSIMAGFNFQNKKLTVLGEKLFNDQKDILAIEVIDLNTREALLSLSKNNENEVLKKAKVESQISSTVVIGLNDEQFMIFFPENTTDGTTLVVKILARFENLLPEKTTSSLLLSQDEKILSQPSSSELHESFKEVLKELNYGRSKQTISKEINGTVYLISSTLIHGTNIRLTSVMNQKVALGALKILFNQSLVFILLSAFVTLAIALVLSSRLTQSLQKLTLVAEKIGHGDFSSEVTTKSGDEVGTLSKAFAKMSKEIFRLLEETKDKARMEAELKTASLVQESLFPKKPHYTNGKIDINGLFVTSTECGGDWWYYFERGNKFYIVIADATGHGTPAALITSAARALFSQIERTDISIEEMMTSWDICVASCSNQKVMMTGLIMEIDCLSGDVKVANASHELPIRISQQNEGFECEPLLLPVGPRLGELKNTEWKTYQFKLEDNDKLIIYTDGLVSIVNPAGKELGERRMLKHLKEIVQDNKNSLDLTDRFYLVFENHRQNEPLPDDVTLVVLEWNKTQPLEKISKDKDLAAS